ncbi:DUF6475 domain-containing protein [Candidatus Regiella insecticola]|uniref:DUF6475 domain-containing protein n=1 Tax=Candidatus Regiella insecticola TaxID=138073 RepID=A0A6L2ZTC0_9ENTR|nr:DUF6475 domain-containing protein [Candidatus Regiella insecticola]GFN47388.1 uncharacterized protein RINTU1_34320 [Candidatus Regiella insecticola]
MLLAEPFNRSLSMLGFEAYWRSLKLYSLAQVQQAILDYLRNPDNSKKCFATPPDLIALIVGDSHTRALQAWAHVTRKIRSTGRYESVKFDDPIIHQVINDMGGWIYLCRQPEKELPFLRHEFEKRYREGLNCPTSILPSHLNEKIEHLHGAQRSEQCNAKPVLITCRSNQAATKKNIGTMNQGSDRPCPFLSDKVT